MLARAEEIAKLGSWEWTPATDRLLWSDNLYRVFGYEPGEIRPSLELVRSRVVEEDLPRFDAAVERLVDEGRFHMHYRIQRPDGEVRQLRASVATVETDYAGRDRMIGTAQDVTEQVEMEARIGQLSRLESVGQFAGGIAHDFNNLLSVISTSADFAAEELEQDSPAAAEIAEIQRTARCATHLTRQLLIFSGRCIPRPERLDLNEEIIEKAQMLVRLLGEAVELRLALSEHLPSVEIDPGRIEQVLVNLLVNARDAMPDGGVVTISTREVVAQLGREADPCRVVRLTVSDSGPGMPDQVARQAFEPFFTTKASGKGTGLGLATVYAVVKEASGVVEIKSRPGRGTSIEIMLPAATDALPS